MQFTQVCNNYSRSDDLIVEWLVHGPGFLILVYSCLTFLSTRGTARPPEQNLALYHLGMVPGERDLKGEGKAWIFMTFLVGQKWKKYENPG